MSFLDLLSMSFVQRAMVSGVFVAILCSTLGLFLVLRKMSMVGDGLAHLSFGAIALGMFFGILPLYVSLPVCILGGIFIILVSDKIKIPSDAAIGIISAFGISLGIIFASLSSGFNVDLMSFLFGNILAVSDLEMYLSAGLTVAVIGLIIFYYSEMFSVTFDEEFARVCGIKTNRFNYLLAILTAITVTLGIRLVGVMLVSAFLIIPAVIALQMAKSFKQALIWSGIFGILSLFCGIFLSLFFNLPTGAVIVATSLVFLLLAVIYRKIFR